MSTKICSLCKKEKNISSFHKRTDRKDSYRTQCKICRNIYFSNYAKINREKITLRNKIRRNNNFEINLINNLRSRINHAISNNSKKSSSLKLLGCSINKLKVHLEKQFKKGMTWDNYGKWHIDHIIPCASFDLTKENEQLKCFNYKNLQPLWANENLSKGAKYE